MIAFIEGLAKGKVKIEIPTITYLLADDLGDDASNLAEGSQYRLGFLERAGNYC